MYDYIFGRIVNSEDLTELDAIAEVLARNVDGLSPTEVSQLRIVAFMQKENVIMHSMLDVASEEKTTP